jgi:AbrB family looped-hinge helix DNA binding protein
MPNQTKNENCCTTIESIIAVDERGQMVLPKDIRKKANINPGDKLALVAHEKDGKVCCMTLMKINDFEQMVKNVLGPMLKDIIE